MPRSTPQGLFLALLPRLPAAYDWAMSLPVASLSRMEGAHIPTILSNFTDVGVLSLYPGAASGDLLGDWVGVEAGVERCV